MMTADNYLKIVLSIVVMIVSPTVIAAESETNSYVIQQYEAFNEALLALNLSQARSLIKKERFHAFSSFVRKVRVDSLWGFYSKRNKASSIDCDARSLCKESNILFLSALAVISIDRVVQKKISSKLIKMGVLGSGLTGDQIQISLTWVLENGEWVIDNIMRIRLDWDPFKRPIDNIMNQKNKK